MNIKEHFETVNSPEGRSTSSENEMCEMKVILNNTTVELQKMELGSNDAKVEDAIIKQPNEEVGRITEEKMKLEMEHGKSTEDSSLLTKTTGDELLSQQELARKTTQQDF